MKPSGSLLAAIGFSVFWATSGVTIKALSQLDPLAIAAFRCFFALALILPITCLRIGLKDFRKGIFQTDQKSWLLISIMVLYIFTVVVSYQLAPVADIVFINGASPIFVLLYKWIKGERIGSRKAIGALLAFTGLIIIVLPNLVVVSPQAAHRLLGIIVGTVSSIAIAAYAIVYFHHSKKEDIPDPYLLNVKIFILGIFLFSILQGLLANWKFFLALQKKDLLLLISLGIFSTALPTICYSIASIALPPIVTTSFRLLTPVLASLFALILFKEIPSYSVFPGGFLILLGLFLMANRSGIKE